MLKSPIQLPPFLCALEYWEKDGIYPCFIKTTDIVAINPKDYPKVTFMEFDRGTILSCARNEGTKV